MLSLACWLWFQICPLGQSGKSHIQPQDIHGSKEGAIFLCASFFGIRNPFLSRMSTNKTWLVPLCEGCHIPITQTNHYQDFPWTNGGESESITQLYPTLCDSMDSSLPGSSAHGILQARILAWVTIPFSRGSFQPRDRTRVSCIAEILYCLSHQGSPYGGESPTKMTTLNLGEKTTNQLDKR